MADERLIHGLRCRRAEGRLELDASTGERLVLGSDTGLEGLQRLAAWLDPAKPLEGADANWLVQHFTSWERVTNGAHHVLEWLSDTGVSRVSVLLNERPALRLRVGARRPSLFRLEGELATLAISRRGEVTLEHHDVGVLEAPPFYRELAERFSPQGADALWRFHHFRRPGQGIAADTAVERIDVGPFTWLRLEADGWAVDVTCVGERAVELRRRRSEQAGASWDHAADQATRVLMHLFGTVELASVDDTSVVEVLARLDCGTFLPEHGLRRDGGRLRFTLRFGDPEPDLERAEFTIDFNVTPPRITSRDIPDPRRLRY